MANGALLAIAAQSSIKRRHGALRAAECGCAQLRAEEWVRKRQRDSFIQHRLHPQVGHNMRAGRGDESALVGIARLRAAEDGRERQKPGGRSRKREAETRRQKSEERSRDPAAEVERERQRPGGRRRKREAETLRQRAGESGRMRMSSTESRR
jgi:hypothetical protein